MDDRASPEDRQGPPTRTSGSTWDASEDRAPRHDHAAADVGGRSPASGEATGYQPLGAQLEQTLIAACSGRLSKINWFRTDWQRGGALTGYASYDTGGGARAEVVVKLPVAPMECRWLVRLQSGAAVDEPLLVPRVYAHGEELGSYDMAWVVMERLPFGPLGSGWEGQEFDLLVQAAGAFYAATAACPVDQPPPAKNWHAIYDQARQHLSRHDLAHEQRWKQALKKVHRKLAEWIKVWDDRPTDQWCHGDLHLANAMTRSAPPAGPAVLLDLAEIHAGCWVEDAVYFEHLYWARRERLGGRKLCKMIARERKAHGLKVEPDWPRLAQIKRALLAMSTPAMLAHDGDPHHVQAALEVLETSVG